jgi:hypothetical protein
MAGKEAAAGEGGDALRLTDRAWFAAVNRKNSQNFRLTVTA